jgi:hypothetical protein
MANARPDRPDGASAPAGPESATTPAPRGGGRISVELVLCAGIAAGIVLLRAAVPLCFEQVFDADQAIVGLMAKHLSEFRGFPLFFYGQNYMLGVQAWMAAPFFRVGGPTLAMLRAPLLLINVAVAVLLVREVARRGVRPVFALAAALPFVSATPLVSMELMFALGASVEPFLYVLCLWALRSRPAAFGALACFGILHREFTVFALPAFAVAGWREWRAWRAGGLARAAASFAGVWMVVAVLKQRVNIYGPAGGVHVTGSLLLQVETLLKRLSFAWEPYLGRLGDLVTAGIPEMFGAGPIPLSRFGIKSTMSQGQDAAAVAMGVAAAVSLARLAWLGWKRGAEPKPDARFFLYLALVAIQTVFAYGLGGGLPVGAPIVYSYVLFTVLLPIAVFAAFFQRETARAWRVPVALLIVCWAGSSVRDNVRLLREYLVTPPPSPHRVMADYLVSKHIKYGRAIYWDAYVITFLAKERVIITPDEVIRISSYKARVDANAATAVTLVRQPCDAGTRVAAWCVIDPLEQSR